jgi:calcium/calmodulin-dependent protein kinase I
MTNDDPPSDVAFPPTVGRYTFGPTLGSGAFAVVKLASRRDLRDPVACKIVPKSRLSSAHLQGCFEREVRIVHQLRHGHIAELVDLAKDDDNYCIFSEYCPNGSLYDGLVARQRYTESDAKVIIRQLLVAIAHIHAKGVAHRDLKPSNILFDASSTVKVCDFGLARFITQDELSVTACGSPCFAAPEVMKLVPYNPLPADMWSAGVILFTTVVGRPPWPMRNQVRLVEAIKNAKYEIPLALSES